MACVECGSHTINNDPTKQLCDLCLLRSELAKTITFLQNRLSAAEEQVVALQQETARLQQEKEQSQAQVTQWKATARAAKKSFCTHCGQLFPKGAKGLLEFDAHVEVCNKHPLHPLRKQLQHTETICLQLHRLLRDEINHHDAALQVSGSPVAKAYHKDKVKRLREALATVDLSSQSGLVAALD